MEKFGYVAMDHNQKKVYFFLSKPETTSGDDPKMLVGTSRKDMIRMLLADRDDKGWHFYIAKTH